MIITPEIKDAISNYVSLTKNQMGITEPIIVYYNWEEIEHFDYPIPTKRMYNKLLGWNDKINGNQIILINVRMHQNFTTIFKSIIHELMHIKFPEVTSEIQIEIFTVRWLETKHHNFGFSYDEEFEDQW